MSARMTLECPDCYVYKGEPRTTAQGLKSGCVVITSQAHCVKRKRAVRVRRQDYLGVSTAALREHRGYPRGGTGCVPSTYYADPAQNP